MLGKFLVHNRLHAIAKISSRVQCGPPRRSGPLGNAVVFPRLWAELYTLEHLVGGFVVA